MTPPVYPSRVVSGTSDALCAWCRQLLEATHRPWERFCGKKCRQAAYRLRKRVAEDRSDASLVDHAIELGDASRGAAEPAGATGPLRFAYADPPYPGLASRYYRNEPDYGGEVDHASLLDRLTTGGYDGWALSTSARALRDVLPLCPPDVRICAWMKPRGVPPATYGLHSCWEPLIVKEGRRLRPGHADILTAHAARLGGSALIGRKPIAFSAWLFRCMGALPGDELDDLFPGSGMVGAAWREYSSDASSAAASLMAIEQRRVASSAERRVASGSASADRDASLSDRRGAQDDARATA